MCVVMTGRRLRSTRLLVKSPLIAAIVQFEQSLESLRP